MSFRKYTTRATKAFDADVESITDYLYLTVGVDISNRLIDNLAKTVVHIATFPQSGNLHYSAVIETVELRMFPVTKFPYYLVFYIAGPDEVVLVRLLHGMRDLSTELEALDTSE